MGNESRLERIESIVFDFDGTLAELLLDFNEMKHRLGLLAQEYLHFYPTPPQSPALEWMDSLATLLSETDDGAASGFRTKAGALILEMEMEAAQRGNLFEFSRPLLTKLRHKGIKTAVITRNCARAVRFVFPDLDDYCAVFLARDHVPRVKPDPDHLLRALQQVSVAPGAALMVGDHPLDIETGKRAETLTAGVWSGRASRSDLIRTGAHWTARNCAELMARLEQSGMI